jgi:hypothetical protein
MSTLVSIRPGTSGSEWTMKRFRKYQPNCSFAELSCERGCGELREYRPSIANRTCKQRFTMRLQAGYLNG